MSGYLEKLELLLTENEALRADIPLQFRPVMTAALDRVDLAIRPGLITIGWSCLGVEPYFANVTAALDQLRQLTKVVSQSYTIESGTSMQLISPKFIKKGLLTILRTFNFLCVTLLLLFALQTAL